VVRRLALLVSTLLLVVATAGAATASPVTASKARAAVDVKITGSQKLRLQGTKATCEPGGGTTDVSLDGADYPQLGPRGYLVILATMNPQYAPGVRARIGKVKYLSASSAQGDATSKVSGRRVTVSNIVASSGHGSIRVSGTIVCP
jgi:hypothetical protein